jgi:hypothetical protein
MVEILLQVKKNKIKNILQKSIFLLMICFRKIAPMNHHHHHSKAE